MFELFNRKLMDANPGASNGSGDPGAATGVSGSQDNPSLADVLEEFKAYKKQKTDEIEKLKGDNAILLKNIIDGETDEPTPRTDDAETPEPTAEEKAAAKEKKEKRVKELKTYLSDSTKEKTNLEYVSAALELNDLQKELTGQSIFIPAFTARNQPTEFDIRTAEKFERIMKENVKKAEGNPDAFNVLLAQTTVPLDKQLKNRQQSAGRI